MIEYRTIKPIARHRAFIERRMRKMSEVKIVIAKCVGCGAKREIKPDEIPKGSHPICNICYMPMIAEKAVRKC